MENRFGVKDFFILLVMCVLIVLVVLAMVQFDRQYDQVLTIKSQNDQLASEVARIKRQISDLSTSGVSVAPQQGGSHPTTTPASHVDAFTSVLTAEGQKDFARGGWFVDNFAIKVGRLTPLVSQDVYATWIEYQVLETLTVRDTDTLQYVPRIAKSWQISPDGLTMRFALRDDATFSDGHPLTADDVVFTYDWIRNPEVNAPRDRSAMTMLKDVKKIDDYTVEFTFSGSYFLNFEVAGGQPIMAKHFYSRFTPNQFNEKVGLLLGSGPYMLENPETWAPGNGVTLVRNPRYWGVPPTFDRMIFTEIEEEAAEEVKYGNQELDFITCLPETFDRLIHDKRIMEFSNSYQVKTPYKGYSYIGWNQKRKSNGVDVVTRFADKRVRQAMTMLIDRERMNKEIMLGYAEVASGPFMIGGPQSDPSIKPWPYDIARAKKLLAEVGYEDRNNDGVIEDREGKPFRFKLSYPGGTQFYEKLVLFLRDNMALGGAVLEPERLDWPVLVDRLRHSDFDSCILAWSSVPEADPYQVFHSSQIADEGDNRTSYSNPELDKAIDQARSTMDFDKRMELWHQVHRILHEDQPYTFMFNRKETRLINKRVHNVQPSKVGQNFEFLNPGMIPWFIPKNQQRVAQ